MNDRKQWANRIVGHADVKVANIVANDLNWRTHLKPQRDAVGGNLEELGIVKSLLINKTTGHLIDGHLRLSLALERRQDTMPVEYVELSVAEEAQALATLDSTSALAGTDEAKLKAVLDEFDTKSPALAGMLDDMAREAGLKDELLEAEIQELKVEPPPKLVWILIGIPLDRFGTVREHLVALQGAADISVQSNRDE